MAKKKETDQEYRFYKRTKMEDSNILGNLIDITRKIFSFFKFELVYNIYKNYCSDQHHQWAKHRRNQISHNKTARSDQEIWRRTRHFHLFRAREEHRSWKIQGYVISWEKSNKDNEKSNKKIKLLDHCPRWIIKLLFWSR